MSVAGGGGSPAGEETVRLFVGGLTPEVTAEDVAGRFRPFGRVEIVELRPDKRCSKGHLCRGFAYVNFTPKDERSMSRCLSLYNGCNWKGQKLRLEKAKPSYTSRLQADWEAEEAEAQKQEAAGAAPAASPSIFARQDARSLVLNLGSRQSKVVAVPLVVKHTPLTHRKHFPPMKSNLTEAALSWEPMDHKYTRHETLAMEGILPTCKGPPRNGKDNEEEGGKDTGGEPGASPWRFPVAFKRSGKADTARGVGQAAPRQTAEAGNGEADEWQTEAEVVEAAVAAARLPKQKRQEATRAGRDHRGAPPGSDAATAKAGKRQREGMAPREVRGEAGAVDANSSDSEDYTALKRQAGLRGSMRGSGEDGDFEIVSGPPGGSLRGPGTSGIGKGPGKPRRNLGGRRGGKSGGPAEEAPDPMWLDRLAAWGSGR